jgi:hypothetical protein
MEIDNSVKNQSKSVKGKILFSIIAIFVAIALGYGVIISLSDKTNRSPSSDMLYNSEKIILEMKPEDIHCISGSSDDVPLAKGRSCYCKNTEKGTIEIDDNICTFDELPLCINGNDNFLSNLKITAKITGKYEPVNGTIKLCQGKNDDDGEILVSWRHVKHVPCYYDIWEASFSLPDGPIELASNQWPDGSYNQGSAGDYIPGKKVKVITDYLFQGCTDKEQQFEYIMAHKNYCAKNPTTSDAIYNFIAGLKTIQND